MLFFFEEEQLDNGYATTSQKEFPKDGNRRYTKFPMNVADFILVKQVFGLTKERTNTSMQSKNVTSAIVLLLTSLKQLTQLNGTILLSLMDTNIKKTEKSNNLCTSSTYRLTGWHREQKASGATRKPISMVYHHFAPAENQHRKVLTYLYLFQK